MSEIKRWTIQRDGDRPLRFKGERIGEGEHGTGGNSGYRCDWNRGVKVHIYRREAGGYVVVRNYWSHWQGEDGRTEAVVCDTPASVLNALTDPDAAEGSVLRKAEADALADAALSDEGIAGVAVEDIG